LDGCVDVAAGVDFGFVDDWLQVGINNKRFAFGAGFGCDEPVALESWAAWFAGVVGFVAVAQWRVFGLGWVDGLFEDVALDTVLHRVVDGRVERFDGFGVGLWDE